jgi:glycosyltransferase involved in cell wall biosynthesis
MKIGIDGRAAKWYRGTGIGTYSFQLISSLNRIDKINNYLIYMPKDYKIKINFKKNTEIRLIEEHAKNNFWEEVNIPNSFVDKNLQLYHVPQNGIGLTYNKKCPFVITLHDVIPSKMPETVSEQYLKIFNTEMPKIIPLCDGIITVSEYSKEDIIKTFNFPREKVFVTYLASEDIYKPLNKKISKAIIKKYYGICDDFILYIGGFSPRKNILGLINAFNMLKTKLNNNLKLIIAGNKGISYRIYKKRVEELNLRDSILFPGFISMEHIPYLYNASDLFVYPSFYEGFGLPPLEAMACGIPVIASNTTSIPEILQDSALLIDPHNIDELFYRMYNVLMDKKLQKSLVAKGFNHVKKLHWNKTAFQTLSAYNEIIKNRKVGN